ncbi:MAG: hypothetical protein L6R37_004827, partial [Teloschistes peruensis]
MSKHTTGSRPSESLVVSVTYAISENIANGEIEHLEGYKVPRKPWSKWLSLKLAFGDVSKHGNCDCAALASVGSNFSAVRHWEGR